MTIENKLIEYANQFPDQEICALIYVDKNNQENFTICKNQHINKKHYFTISPYDYIKTDELGEIKAVFHSHINDEYNFSPLDYQQSTGHGLDFWLFNVKSKTFKKLDFKNHKYLKYINQEFSEGDNDCFSLVQEFYKNEFNIEIPNYFKDRQKNFLAVQQEVLNKKIFIDLAIKNRFIIVKDSLKNFDILIFKFDNRLHMAIYLEPNCLLHQVRQKKSCIEKMTNEYCLNLIATLRKE